MYASSFAPPRTQAPFSASYAVRGAPDAGRSRAAVGPNNGDMHFRMLEAYGIAMDRARFESTVGSTYLDFYVHLLGRAATLGLVIPPLVVAGHAVPDLRMDETPSIRLIGRFDGPVSTFAVLEESPIVALIAVQAATAAARSQGLDAFALLLADRADLVYGSALGGGGVKESGLLLRFDLGDNGIDTAPRRVQWRHGLTSPRARLAAAEELAASAAGPIVMSADLAAQWEGSTGEVVSARSDQPATGLFEAALDLPRGSEPLLIAVDDDRNQMAAMSFRVPEVHQ